MLRIALSLLLVVMSVPALAALKCEVDLQYGLVVNKRHIRITEDAHTHYQINDAKQLIVRGEWIELDEKQEALLHELASGIHYAVPKVIILASEGVDLAISTVDHVYVGLIGSDNDNYERLQKALWRVREKVKGKFIRANENFYIGPRSLEDVDEIMDPELEREIEGALNTSIGGILSAIGGLSSEGDSSIEKRMEELSRRLETMGAEIERRIAPQANTLRKKAEWFCNEMTRLDRIEEELRATVPALKPYDLIVTGNAKASK
ncbi:YggN family protein [Aliiglaciecola sp. CAU 1673]|uniref:YggN family protein n=1 Tax=Aliiglaciecola sp. CAU 1673 TaxID=3032595 RepID=UPI0023DAA66D|nr:YggN family protein [Aliiglaciecola sp. CAU 1673]MDF2177445.1 YggN family protein [Aliiglaciecola sp. CAU 1673]